MALLVDEPRWWWRGMRWAHLISDVDVTELHPVAHAIGLRRMGFQGDHYDVPEPLVASLVDHGVDRVTSRELVSRLRRSGLRRPPGVRVGHWDVVAAVDPGADPAARAAALTRPRDVVASARIAGAIVAVDRVAIDAVRLTVMERGVGTVACLEPASDLEAWAEVTGTLVDPGAGRRSGAVVVVHDRPQARLVEVIGAEP